MKKFILSITLIIISILTLTACTPAAESDTIPMPENNKLIVYTSHKPEIYEPIIKEFEERSGIWVEVVQGGTNEILDRIAAENNENSADIMFGGGVDSLEVYTDYFEPYRTSQYDNLDKSYSSEGDYYTVFSKLPIVFIYNDKLVIQAGKPRSWEELLSTRWKGKIAFANPNQSGSSYTGLVTFIQAMNSDYDDETVIKNFIANLDGKLCESSGAILDSVISGKNLIGVTLEETALKRIDAGADIQIVYPLEGTSALPDGSAILKNAPHQNNAELFMEFIVGDDVQRLLEEQLYRRSVRTDISTQENVSELDYDIEYAIESREQILQMWDEASGE